jgi:Txe/YoeB family toxin of Txe-Axe toxin-antitoxin module
MFSIKKVNKKNQKLEARIFQVRELRKEPKSHKLEPLKYQSQNLWSKKN